MASDNTKSSREGAAGPLFGDPSAGSAVPVDLAAPTVEMAVQTSPGADCSLHRQGLTGAANQMHLMADGEGLVRFYTNASGAAPPRPGRSLALDCTLEDGRTAPTQLIDPLHAAAFAAARAVQPPTTVSSWRPALVDDPMALTQAELLARGYPPRPEPAKAPDRYARWRQVVSIPARQTSAKTVPHPSIKNGLGGGLHGPISREFVVDFSQKWTGAVVPSFGQIFYDVGGEYTVPAVSPLPDQGSGATVSSLWVGLGGSETPDLVQAGTNQAFYANLDYGDTYDAWSAYYNWIEWLPLAEIGVSLPVSPGDVMWVDVWVGQANGSPDPTGGYGWFYMFNETSGLFYYGSILQPAGTTFSGSSFEAVMERPTACDWFDGCQYTWLSNFGTAQMEYIGAYANDDIGYHTLTTDIPENVTMFGASGVLATSDVSELVQFHWHNYW
jgi:hypothetical protein